VTPYAARQLKKALEARWPEAADVDVKADPDGARVQMKVDGRDHLFIVADNGPLLRLFLLSGRPGEP
jgi:hypothetical protein